MEGTSKIYTGQISHLRQDNGYGVIEYIENGETKSILFLKDIKDQLRLRKQKLIGKIHKFRNGDIVEFQIKPSEKDSSKQIACNVFYKGNEAINLLLAKSESENEFLGYLKCVGEKYFVKEVESYLFIPIDFSKWEILPENKLLNTLVSFKLINTGKINKLSAKLIDIQYHHDFQIIKEYWTKGNWVPATVNKLHPLSISVKLLNGQFNGKLSFKNADNRNDFEIGQEILVKITNIDSDVIGVSLN